MQEGVYRDSITDDRALLLAAYCLLSRKSQWIRGQFHVLHETREDQFCIIGGVREVAKDDGSPDRAECHLNLTAQRLYGKGATDVNDLIGYEAARYILMVAAETIDILTVDREIIYKAAKRNRPKIGGAK